MESMIGEIQPTARPVGTPDRRRIGGDASDLKFANEPIDVRCKPGRVPRFTDDIASKASPEGRQERPSGRSVER
jgi:hypothetical protein